MGWIGPAISAVAGYLGSQGSSSSSSGKTDLTETFNLGSRDVGLFLDQIIGERRAQRPEDIQANALTRAETDVSGVVGNLFTQYEEQVLPEIFSAQIDSGAYGTTGAQTLANDAFARTTAQAAETTLGVANTYAAQALEFQNRQEQLIASLFQLDLAQTGTTRTRGRTSGTQPNNTAAQLASALIGSGVFNQDSDPGYVQPDRG